jgi:FkbM family methyltransferase
MNRKTISGAVRNLVPSWARRAVHRVQQAIDPFGRTCYAQEGEDMLLARLLEAEPTGFYVDVGAHHPLRFSNTYVFYQRGWNGINIEADPDAVPLFRRLRPRDTHVQCGVSDRPGTLTYYRFEESALNTFDAGLAAERAGHWRTRASIQVPVTTLAEILSSHLPAGQAISFLSIDVEGHDLAVLRSNDWARYRPPYVLSESLRSSLATLDSDPQCRFMASVGYEAFAKTVNTVVYRDRGM